MAHGNVSRCEESSLHDVCCGRLSALTDRELSERLTALPGWELVDGKLRHTFGFGSFDQSMKFVAKIAAIADKFNHHPDICVNRPGMSGDSSSWKGWGHVRWFIEEVPAGA
ncbi:hypothetical protein T572_04060, partial [Mycobacterium tuberculosis UT0034]